MDKIVHATTKLPENVVKELKRKTGESTTKDALYIAITHYLYCHLAMEEIKIKEQAGVRIRERV